MIKVEREDADYFDHCDECGDCTDEKYMYIISTDESCIKVCGVCFSKLEKEFRVLKIRCED